MAGQASKSARQIADQFKKTGGEANTALARQARDLAQRQQRLVEHFRRLANSPADRKAAQQAGQQQLEDATKKLSNQFAGVAEKLGSDPLNLAMPAQQTRAAGQLSDQSRREMGQTNRSLDEGDARNASQTARKAADLIRQAAKKAAQAAGESAPPDSPVPGTIAEKVAEAAQRLARAREELAQARRQLQNTSRQPANPTAAKQAAKSQGQAGNQQGKPGSSGQNRPSSKSPLANSAQHLDEAAQALSQAARQMQPNRPNDAPRLSKPGQSGRNASSSQTQQANSSQGNDGRGARASLEPGRLEAELKKLSLREWGRLPGHLRTEILASSRKKSNSDYARLIKMYFQEIARTHRAQPENRDVE